MHVAVLKPYHRRTENFVLQEETENIVKRKQYSSMPVLEEKTAEEIEGEPAIDGLTQQYTVQDLTQQEVLFQEFDSELPNNLSQQKVTLAEIFTDSTCISTNLNAPVLLDNANIRRLTSSRGKQSRFFIMSEFVLWLRVFHRPSQDGWGRCN